MRMPRPLLRPLIAKTLLLLAVTALAACAAPFGGATGSGARSSDESGGMGY